MVMRFFKCVDLKKVTIPSTVTSIGYDTFLGCTSLENIVVDTENKNYISLSEQECCRKKICSISGWYKNINHKVANLFFCLFSAETEEQQRHINSLADKLSIIENAQKNITTYLTKEFIAFQKYPKLNEQYIQVQKVEELLNTYKTCEKLRERHSKQLIEKEEKII